jgi:hypothetical protein
MDLVTVVMHEFGHVLGIDHTTSDGILMLLMSGTLDAGKRLMPAATQQSRNNGRSAQQYSALIFDELNGTLGRSAGPRKAHRVDPYGMLFDPAQWKAKDTDVTENRADWIVKV